MLLKKAGESGEESVFVIDDLNQAMLSKKEEIARLKAEENERLKTKIATKLQEKAMEESEMAKTQTASKNKKKRRK